MQTESTKTESQKWMDKLLIKNSNSKHHTEPYKAGYSQGAFKVFEYFESENQRLQSLNDTLVEALKPFADMFGEITESKIQQGGTIFQYNDKHITVSDFYAAYNALNPIK